MQTSSGFYKGDRLTQSPTMASPTLAEVIAMAQAGQSLVRDPTHADKESFRAAFATGGKGWATFKNVLSPVIRDVLRKAYYDTFDKVCPNWRTKGFNGSHACSIVKPYGIPTGTWESWIVRLAYIQWLKALTGDGRDYACSMDALAFSLLSHETKKSTTTPHTDMSTGSPSFKLEQRRQEMGEPFPCLQAQVNIEQHPNGTELRFGRTIPLNELTSNNKQDYTKVEEPVTQKAQVESGDVVMWRSNTVHATRKSGIRFKPGAGIGRIGQFACAYPKVYRSEKAKRDKIKRFLQGMATGHLPTVCVKDGGRNHMSNHPARKDTYCTPLPCPTNPSLVAFAKTLV